MENNKLSFGLSVFIFVMLFGLTVKFIFDAWFGPAFVTGVMTLMSGVFVKHDFSRLKE
jgi:hypothetical protein